MSSHHIAIQKAGLVTSVGLTAPQSCAAFRAKISNPTETGFMDSGGELIMAHQVPLARPWSGLMKLTKMAAMVIEEALSGVEKRSWRDVPLLLCVAETDRPGRMEGLEDQLFLQIQNELDVTFGPDSAVVIQGRVGVAVALVQARALIAQRNVSRVLIAAVDSLLNWQTLTFYEHHDRLLTGRNSNGFIPGEAAGALLVGLPDRGAFELVCTGIGFGREVAHFESQEPLRADGLASAIKGSLSEAGIQMHDMDFRITDSSGEHYYFKEAALALSRTLRQRKEAFDIWHPAECTGEIGACVGATVIALAQAACNKAYTKGRNILVHMANDAGQRAALSLQYRTPR